MPKLQDQVDADGDRGDLGTGARVAESKKLRGRREAANERLKAIREEARKAEEKEEGGKDRILRDKKEEVEKILDDMEVLDTAIDLEERLEQVGVTLHRGAPGRFRAAAAPRCGATAPCAG